jgi:regulator of RNase E activity RraB
MMSSIIKLIVALSYKTLTAMLGQIYYHLNKIFNILITAKWLNKNWNGRNERTEKLEWKDFNFSFDKYQLYIPYNNTSLPLTDEGCKEIIEQLFNILMKNDRFRITESYKYVGLHILTESGRVGMYNSLHPSIIINRNTKFEDYWKSVGQDIMDELIDVDVTGAITFVFSIGNLTVPSGKKLEITNGIGKIVSEQRTIIPFNRIELKRNFTNKRSIHTSAVLNQESYEIELLKQKGVIVDVDDLEGLKRQRERHERRLEQDKNFAPQLKQLMINKFPTEFEMISKMNPTLDLEEIFMLCLHYHFEKGLIEIINSGYDPKIGKYVFEMYANHRFNSIKEDLKALFYTLTTNEAFEEVCDNKLVLLQAWLDSDKIYTIHHAVLINKFTTFEDYWNEVMKEAIKWDDLYDEDALRFDFIVINIDEEIKLNPQLNIISDITKATAEHGLIIRRKHPLQGKRPGRKSKRELIPIKLGKRNISSIKPIPVTKFKANFSVMDIETVNIDNIQVPICITFCSEIANRIFMIDPLLYTNQGLKKASDQMWKNFFDYLSNPAMRSHVKTIFTHNLGGFDGYFIYSALLKYFDDSNKYDLIIDDKNKIISIQLNLDDKFTISFKDSFRIFPVSLDNLCKSFGVKGKLMKYDSRYQYIDFLFTNLVIDFKEYALQDSRALFNALKEAQNLYFNNFGVDITSIHSTSSLSLKVLRTKFLKEDITILNSLHDEFVRPAYLGGATDYYKEYATKVHCYDINSLYPYAMLNDLPNTPIKKYKNMEGINLDDFFGYAIAEIETPNNIDDNWIPLLPYKDIENGRTIHPVGRWKGTYFSEELKAAVNLGYKVKPIEGLEFSKFRPFDDYIDHFYQLKKNSEGGTRFIAKMQLNQLYGIFGRRQELLKAVSIDKIAPYAHLEIKSMIDVCGKNSTLLLKVTPTIIQEMLANGLTDQKFNNQVKSNVAIAAAVTSYARIVMHRYKLYCGIHLCYSDTDSIFTDKPIDSKFVGPEIGQLKLEAVYKEAVFIAP